MKGQLSIMFLIVLSGCVAQESKSKDMNIPNCQKLALSPGDYDCSIEFDGFERRYRVHLPPTYDEKIETPLVLIFHGGGGNAEGIIESTRMNDKSNSAGFILVYPEGTGKFKRSKNFLTWNAGECCPPAKDNDVDDVGFIEVLLDKLEEDLSIDTKRIYAAGISNGGMMVYRLACELSNRIAAIASVCGPMGVDSCNPIRPISVMHFHGTADPCVPYEGGMCGGCIAELLNLKEAYLFPCDSTKKIISDWIKRNNCPTTPKVTYQKGEAICKTYSQCDGGTEVTLCTIEGGGHTWPGAHKVRSERYYNIVGEISYDINANDVMWEFFLKHPMSNSTYNYFLSLKAFAHFSDVK